MKFKYPEIATTRIVKKFPIIPLKLGTQGRWLEICYVKQHWNGSEWRNDYFVERSSIK